VTNDPPPSTTPKAPDDLVAAFRERGWPTEVIERAVAIGVPTRQLRNMTLVWNAPLERFEQEIGWAERVLDGPIRYRQLTMADNEQFCELWANSHEEIGDWDVTVLRGPNGFAQFELQERPVLNGLFDRVQMVACVSFSLRNTIVGGERLSVRYGQAMRVHKDHRRHGYAHWVRSIPWAVGIARFTQVQYDYLRARNMTMERWNKKFMPNVDSVPKREDEVPGIPVTVLQFPATATGGGSETIRTATPADIEQCVRLINRTHAGRDLFRPYTAEFLADRLDEGFWGARPPDFVTVYRWDDMRVLERAGEIVACAGLWDRGRDLREHWRHRETGAERTVAATALLDFGHAEGHAEALAALIDHLVGETHALGRDFLLAPLESLPDVAQMLASREPVPETRYLQWRTDTPAITSPTYVDLGYW
jgi:hypothetical protein